MKVEGAPSASVIERSLIRLSGNDGLNPETAPKASPRSVVADFEMQRQHYSNWCWAAVAASISSFYDPNSTFSQCKIANLDLHRSDCCDNAGRDHCNQVNTLASPLNRVGCLVAMARHRRATPAQLLRELENRRPLCARIVWYGGGGHFLGIAGYLDEAKMVIIKDPFFGTTILPYNRFAMNYQDGQGVWEDTFYTKARN